MTSRAESPPSTSTNSLGIPDHPEGRPRMMLNQDLPSSNESSPPHMFHNDNSDGRSLPSSASEDEFSEVIQSQVVPGTYVDHRRVVDDGRQVPLIEGKDNPRFVISMFRSRRT